ncbi:MAG: hypothetical protein LBT29_04970 [Flavobacteriaceae bacterium]|nr:hypothetical protein [Flavobacteriaceae bacterium]
MTCGEKTAQQPLPAKAGLVRKKCCLYRQLSELCIAAGCAVAYPQL